MKYKVKNNFGEVTLEVYHITEAIAHCVHHGFRVFEDNQKLSQERMIIEAMKAGFVLNKWNTMNLANCMTLAQRIKGIREKMEVGLILQGWKLCTDTVKDHKNASKYWLERKDVIEHQQNGVTQYGFNYL